MSLLTDALPSVAGAVLAVVSVATAHLAARRRRLAAESMAEATINGATETRVTHAAISYAMPLARRMNYGGKRTFYAKKKPKAEKIP